MALVRPITLPSILNIGPPELPLFMEASVWIKLSKEFICRFLFKAEIIPVETEVPRLNGLPTTIIKSPTIRLFDGSNCTYGSLVFRSIFRRATSIISSIPIISAGKFVSDPFNLIFIFSALSITWLLVII